MRLLRRRAVDPATYWESRAPDLIEGYDHPETWAERNWQQAGIEEQVVARILRESGVRSVLVVGAGTGRQYEFLTGFDVRGFDLSPSLVSAALERHSGIETVVDDVIGAEQRHVPADAVLATGVLQHISPDRIEEAAASVAALARRLIVLREAVWLAKVSSYQWAHDYDALFHGWRLAESVVTDEQEHVLTELRAYISGDRPAAVNRP